MSANMRLFSRSRSSKIAALLGVLSLLLLGFFVSCGKKGTESKNSKPQITQFKITTAGQELDPSQTNLIAGGTKIEIKVAASDPDGDELTYRWLCSTGSLSDSSGTVVIWTAPTFSVDASVSIEISDGRLSASRSAAFQVWTGSTLTAGGVSPGSGVITDIFAFKVTYLDPDNQPPKSAEIMIDGETYPVSLTSGNYVTGAVYEFQLNLAKGSHQYRFQFTDYRDSLINYPSGGYAVGPLVSEDPDQIPWDSVIVIDELTNVSLVDVTGTEYVLDYWGVPPEIRPGAILAGSDRAGFLRRVVQVDIQPDKIIIITRDAPIDSAIKKSLIDTTFVAELFPRGFDTRYGFVPTYLSPGVGVTAGVINLKGTKLFEGRVGEVDVLATIKEGRVDFEPELDIGWTIEWFSLKEFHAVAGGNLEFVCDVEVTSNGSFSLKDSVLIAQFVHDQIIFVGVLPVTVRYTLSFMAEFQANADLNGSIEGGFEFLNEVRAGAQYKDGYWRSIWHYDSKLIPHDPVWTADASIYARTCIKPRLDVELYSCAGPYIEIEPYLGLDASVQMSPPCWEWELFGGIDGYLGFQAHILSFQLANYSVQLLEYRVTIAADSDCVDLPPSPPTLYSPSNGSTTEDNTPSFDWNDPQYAYRYELIVDNNSSFTSPEIHQTNLSSSNYTPSSGLSDGLYYWKVRAKNSAGVWGNWSGTWTFTVDTPSLHLWGGYTTDGCTVERYGNWPGEYISLTTHGVEIESDAQNGTPPCHWKIEDDPGYIQLTFNTGAIPFHDSVWLWIRALGSTFQGVSYAYINVSVNGAEIVDCRHLEDTWIWYYLSWNTLKNYLMSGENTFRISWPLGCDLIQTYPWIKNIQVEAWDDATKSPVADTLHYPTRDAKMILPLESAGNIE